MLTIAVYENGRYVTPEGWYSAEGNLWQNTTKEFESCYIYLSGGPNDGDYVH